MTALNEKGIPTPLVQVYLRAPQSRMDILTPAEINRILDRSSIKHKYDELINRESAYEILSGKIEEAQSKKPKKTERTSRKCI